MRKSKSNKPLRELIKLSREFRNPEENMIFNDESLGLDLMSEPVDLRDSILSEFFLSIKGLDTEMQIPFVTDLFRMLIPDRTQVKDILFNIALKHDENEDWEDSLFYYRLSNLLEPNAKAYNNMAIVYANLGKTDYAVDKLQTGLELFPENKDLNENLSILLEEE